MTLHLYGIAACDRCRKARRWLAETGLDAPFTDLRKDCVEAARVAGWEASVGWETLLNRRSTTWRQLSDSERDIADSAAAVALMTAHPTLIKRPVLEIDGDVTVGFGPDVVARLRRRSAS
jgi:Spx/MgsR family transcriptional regulator